MKLIIINFNKILIKIYKNILYDPIIKENIEIIKLLLNNDKIDINFKNI